METAALKTNKAMERLAPLMTNGGVRASLLISKYTKRSNDRCTDIVKHISLYSISKTYNRAS